MFKSMNINKKGCIFSCIPFLHIFFAVWIRSCIDTVINLLTYLYYRFIAVWVHENRWYIASVFCVFNFVLLQLKMNDIPITLYKGFYRLFCVTMGLYTLCLVYGFILPLWGLYGMAWSGLKADYISRQILSHCYIYVNFVYKAFKGT